MVQCFQGRRDQRDEDDGGGVREGQDSVQQRLPCCWTWDWVVSLHTLP